MLVAAGPRVLAIADGTPLILDAERGRLELDPPHERLDAVREEADARARQLAADRANAHAPAVTVDGVTVGVSANLGSVGDAAAAVELGADGCGLLRTEFLFLERREPPSEDEQHDTYQRIADALQGRPLTIRTMDIGGDKPIPFLELPREENPALGLRGLRGSLWQPELLKTQLRAILRVRPEGQRRVLLPMVTEVQEIRTVRALVMECCAELGVAAPPELGAMIETPASALLAGQLLEEADFSRSARTTFPNTCSRWTVRQPALAPRLDALHPAVLRLVSAVAAAGRGTASTSRCAATSARIRSRFRS
jgi:phosphoenolpyruvate-protein kinase (PTS system EI component)